MKRPIPMLAALVAAAFVAGCQEDENQTVEYFSENPDARAEMLESCEVSDRAFEDANCVNAEQAELEGLHEKESEAAERLFGEPSFD